MGCRGWPVLVLVVCFGCTELGEGEGGPCDQECADQHLAYGIQWSVMSLFNAASGTLGAVQTDLECGFGGAAQVTGTVDGDVEALLDADLAFDMTGCEEARGSEYHLVLDGVVQQAGAFENAGTVVEFAFTSDEVAFQGMVNTDLGEMEFDDSCALDTLLACDDLGQCETRGSVCGREFEPLISAMIGG
jgi:hypothetical protein